MVIYLRDLAQLLKLNWEEGGGGGRESNYMYVCKCVYMWTTILSALFLMFAISNDKLYVHVVTLVKGKIDRHIVLYYYCIFVFGGRGRGFEIKTLPSDKTNRLS